MRGPGRTVSGLCGVDYCSQFLPNKASLEALPFHLHLYTICHTLVSTHTQYLGRQITRTILDKQECKTFFSLLTFILLDRDRRVN